MGTGEVGPWERNYMSLVLNCLTFKDLKEFHKIINMIIFTLRCQSYKYQQQLPLVPATRAALYPSQDGDQF